MRKKGDKARDAAHTLFFKKRNEAEDLFNHTVKTAQVELKEALKAIDAKYPADEPAKAKR